MKVLKYFAYTVILCVVVSLLFVLYAPVFGGSQSTESLQRIKHSRNFVEDKNTLSPLKARIAFRDITNRTNSRTVIACLLPPKTFITNKGPVLINVHKQVL